MAAFTIRPAGMRDAPAIAHVHVASWRTTYKGLVPDRYLAALDEAGRIPLWEKWLALDVSIFVAELEGRIVGFACGGAIRDPIGDYDAELYSIYLLKDAQGRGIGRALLGSVARALLGRGFRSMTVWVLETNPAVGFYEKAGGRYLERKKIEIGGRTLHEIAYGWPDLGLPAGAR